MSKSCAICLRGRCLDDNLEINQFGVSKKIDYKKCIKSVFNKIIYSNPEINFDFYLHGWVSNDNSINNILNDYKPKKYILEKQINFKNDYIDIKNYKNILRDRYKHLHNKNQYNYDNIHFQNYFQNIFSYAYSISKVIALIPEDKDYDYIIHLRYDVHIDEYINFKELGDKIYTDNIGSNQSPLFLGDFIYCSSKQNALFMKNIYTFLKHNIFNNEEYKYWVKNIIDNKPKNATGRYEHGIYSNQMIYAYFIYKNSILYKNIIPKINCHIIN